MGRYLLQAEDADMERWKAAAADTGLTFAAWCRAALDAFEASEQPTKAEGVSREVGERAARVPGVASSKSDLHFKPDFGSKLKK